MDMDDLVKNLRLECKICYEQYSDSVMPKMLHCSHSFCEGCIEKLVGAAIGGDSSTIRCPYCRKKNKFQPSKGVDSFKDNLDLRNVASSVQPTEVPSPSTASVSPSHRKDTPVRAQEEETTDPDGPCRTHGAEMNRYCTQCSSMICYECVLSDHYGHADAIIGVAEHSQKVRQEMIELLELARDLPFMRIRKAAEKTRKLAEEKREGLLGEVDRVVEAITVEIQDDLEALDEAKQRLKQLGDGALSDISPGHRLSDTEEARQSMRDVGDLLDGKISGRNSRTDIGLKFIGMRPDGSIGDFVKDKVNTIGNIAHDRTVIYVADNRKQNSAILVGVGHLGGVGVSKWMKSFRAEDGQSPVVFSSQILEKGQERLLLVAIGHFIYKIDTSIGQCIADQISTIHVREGVILLGDSSSITGIDWFPDQDKALAILSLNTGKSLFLIDTDTKALVKSITTPIIPAIISCRRGDKSILTIVRDNSSQSKLVILNQNGKEEFRISPSKGITGYIPWVGCWVQAAKPLRVAVVWCQSYKWKIVVHDSKNKGRELEEHEDIPIPVSISYEPNQKTFAVCSTEATHHYPLTF